MKLNLYQGSRVGEVIDIENEIDNMLSNNKYHSRLLSIGYEHVSVYSRTKLVLLIKANKNGTLYLSHEVMGHDVRRSGRSLEHEELEVQRHLLANSEKIRRKLLEVRLKLRTIGDWLKHYRLLSGYTRPIVVTLTNIPNSAIASLELHESKIREDRVKQLLELYSDAGVPIEGLHVRQFDVDTSRGPGIATGLLMQRTHKAIKSKPIFLRELEGLLSKHNC